MLDALRFGAHHLLTHMLAVGPADQLLVLSDITVYHDVREAMGAAARDMEADVVEAVLNLPYQPGPDLPRSAAAAMTGATAIVVASRFHPAFFRTRAAWRAINEFGVPLIHLDPPHRVVLSKAPTMIKPNELRAIAAVLERQMRGASTFRILQQDGELVARFDPRTINLSRVFPIRRGFTVCPPGVCVFMPELESVSGRIAFDMLDGFAGPAEQPITMEVRGGRILRVDGGKEARYLREVFESMGDADVLSELGIGINPGVVFSEVAGSEWHEAINRAAGVVHAGIGATFWRRSATPFHVHAAAVGATVIVEPGAQVVIDSGRLTALSEVTA